MGIILWAVEDLNSRSRGVHTTVPSAVAGPPGEWHAASDSVAAYVAEHARVIRALRIVTIRLSALYEPICGMVTRRRYLNPVNAGEVRQRLRDDQCPIGNQTSTRIGGKTVMGPCTVPCRHPASSF